jgi:hypothetical protein
MTADRWIVANDKDLQHAVAMVDGLNLGKSKRLGSLKRV